MVQMIIAWVLILLWSANFWRFLLLGNFRWAAILFIGASVVAYFFLAFDKLKQRCLMI